MSAFSNLFKRKNKEEFVHQVGEGDGMSISLSDLIYQKKYSNLYSNKNLKKIRMGDVGFHKSTVKGRGMEMDELRLYHAGDDIRSIDWKVSARIGKTYTKLYREEKECQMLICSDLRSHMHFGTRKQFKSVLVSKLSAALSWAFQNNGDKVGGFVLSDQNIDRIKPSRQKNKIMELFNSLVVLTNKAADFKNEKMKLSNMLEEICHISNSGGNVYIISDFVDFDENAKKCLTMFCNGGCKIYCIHVYDALEKSAPPVGDYYISCDGKINNLNIPNEKWQENYNSIFEAKTKNIKDFCFEHQIGYILVNSSQDISSVLNNLQLQ